MTHPEVQQIMDSPELQSLINRSSELAHDMVMHIMYTHGKNGIDVPELVYRIYCEGHKAHFPKLGKYTRCKAGCNYCCHLRVSTSVSEVLALVYWLKKYWSAKRIAELVARLEDYQQAKYLYCNTWVHEAKPCVFLTEKGTCQIYKFRPLSCRAFNSCDAKMCKLGYKDKKVLGIPINLQQRCVFESMSYGISRAVSSLIQVEDTMNLELSHALYTALTEKNAVENWLNKNPSIFKPFETTIDMQDYI